MTQADQYSNLSEILSGQTFLTKKEEDFTKNMSCRVLTKVFSIIWLTDLVYDPR